MIDTGSSPPVLDVAALRKEYRSGNRVIEAVRSVTFGVGAGEFVLPRWPIRLRQDHIAQVHGRAHGAHER